MLLLVFQLKKSITTFYTMFVCSIRLQTFFDHYKLLSMVIYYLRQPYTTSDGYILLLTAVYYFRRLYITFDGYVLLLALPDCDFVRIQDFLAIVCICGLKARLESNLLSPVLLFLQFNGFFYKFQCTLLKMLFYQKYSNAENVKFSSPCATNGSQGKQVRQTIYIN